MSPKNNVKLIHRRPEAEGGQPDFPRDHYHQSVQAEGVSQSLMACDITLTKLSSLSSLCGCAIHKFLISRKLEWGWQHGAARGAAAACSMAGLLVAHWLMQRRRGGDRKHGRRKHDVRMQYCYGWYRDGLVLCKLITQSEVMAGKEKHGLIWHYSPSGWTLPVSYQHRMQPTAFPHRSLKLQRCPRHLRKKRP